MKLKWGKMNLTQYVASVTWSGSDMQASRSLEFSIAHNPRNKDFKTPNIKLGDVVKFYDDKGKLRFVGKVFNRDKTSDIGSISYTAHDYMIHLLKSKATYKFKNKPPEKIAKKVCKVVKMKTGSLAKTKMKISKLFFEEIELYNIILAGYKTASKKNGKKYMLTMNGTKLEVIKKGEVIKNFTLRDTEKVFSSSYSQNLDDVFNKVAIYNKNNKRVGTVSNKKSIKKYGTFQETLKIEKKKGNGKAKAKKMLNNPSQEASIESIGDVRCIAGKGVNLIDSATGLKGTYWIENDSHTWENGTHKMTLDLRFSNVMESASATSSKAGSSKAKSKKRASSGTKKADSIIDLAKSFVGKVKYVFGASNPPGGKSDCSGFTQYVFKKAAGKSIGRTTLEQVKKGKKIKKSKAAAGDLVFFKNTYRSGVSHVGIMTGAKSFIHCGSSKGVCRASLTESYWASHFLEIRRL